MSIEEIHRDGCRCRSCVDYKKAPKSVAGKGCPPGCTCRRHNPRHREDCLCNRCGGAAMRPPKPKPAAGQPWSKSQRKADVIPITRKSGFPRRDDVCICGHIESRHDPFGCKTCSTRLEKRVSGAKPCPQFRSRTGYSQRANKATFEREVKDEGFIKHIGELATCTACWTVVKLGDTNTLTSVISARAHVQICTARVRAEQERRRPGKGYGVG
jgi:hypothetical protein